VLRAQAFDCKLRETPRRGRIDATANTEHVSLQTAHAQVLREERDAPLDFPLHDEILRDVHFRGNAPLAFGRIELCHVLPLQVCGCPKGAGRTFIRVSPAAILPIMPLICSGRFSDRFSGQIQSGCRFKCAAVTSHKCRIFEA